MVMEIEATDVLSEFIVTRSPELREKLVLQNVPLVHYMLVRMGISRESGMEYEDLVHHGLIGLMEAVDLFRAELGTRFSTFACIRIRGRITDYLRTSDWMPRSARRRSHLIQKSINTFWLENKREPTDEELAATMGLAVEEIREGLADANRVLISLDIMENRKGEEGLLHDFIPDENQAIPSDRMDDGSLAQELAAAIQYLARREQLILSLYYNDELTFREIGRVLNIHESRVCQLHARAILNLKALMNKEQNDEQ